MQTHDFVRGFHSLSLKDLPIVGGKNASLGELHSTLVSNGVRIPDGFATTADAYWYFLDEAGIRTKIQDILATLDRTTYANLSNVGQAIRTLIIESLMPPELCKDIISAYRTLCQEVGSEISVAVRSSATAEDLPTASFAGLQESYLNIKGIDALLRACQLCYASLFTDRAIKYREEHGFDHMKVALSIGVQQMVRSDKGSSGVGFTLDPETGFRNVILITGSWGLGENVVQGSVNPDEFYLFKPSLTAGKYAILSRTLGTKAQTMIYAEDGEGSISSSAKTTVNIETPAEKRSQYVLTDNELHELGRWLLLIEEHYGSPMDIEWAKDGLTDELFIVQARPETVHSQKQGAIVTEYVLASKGEVIIKGEAIGSKIAAGRARIFKSIEEGSSLEPGDIIVTDSTSPDWDPLLKRASGIITNRGGRTSHAAIIAREIGIAAVVGCGNATSAIKEGEEITISCAEGESGKIYRGKLPWKTIEHDLSALPKPRTKVMFILGDPDQAFKLANYPVDGVGLLRLEFAITNAVKVHPMALVQFEKVTDATTRAEIEGLTSSYPSKEEYFVAKLSEAVGTIAAAFYPREVIVRMSDFKTNEYANLIGGTYFEPVEENPMLGFRGASRYYDERYLPGFELECKVIRRLREEMGLTNVKIMIPFCRTVEEGKKVIEVLRANGLERGKEKLEVYVMAEIPSNILLASEFAEHFDGFSIGSNDLTQLTLGIDRDSSTIRHLFDEQNPAVKKLIGELIEQAHRRGRKVGLCGQAPSDHPNFAQFLVEEGIDSVSFNPDALFTGLGVITTAEEKTGRIPIDGRMPVSEELSKKLAIADDL